MRGPKDQRKLHGSWMNITDKKKKKSEVNEVMHK